MNRLELVAAGLVTAVLLAGCSTVVKEPPSEQLQVAAPQLVEVDPAVEAAVPAPIGALSRAQAKRVVRRAALRIRSTKCDDMPTGSGFALDSKTLIAHQDVLPGTSRLKVAPRKGRAVAVDASSVYRLGDFGIARVGRRLPRMLPVGGTPAGASVVVVGYPLGPNPRLLPGVLVDSVPGAPFGVRGRVLRLTSALEHDEPGGPVLDAKGRIVALAFTIDPETGLAVAVPVPTLRELVAAHKLEALGACD